MASKTRLVFFVPVAATLAAASMAGFLGMPAFAMSPVVGPHYYLTAGAFGVIDSERAIPVALHAAPLTLTRDVGILGTVLMPAPTMCYGSIPCSHTVATQHVLTVGHGPTVERVAASAGPVVTYEVIEFVALRNRPDHDFVNGSVGVLPMPLVPSLPVSLRGAIARINPATRSPAIFVYGSLQKRGTRHLYNLAHVGT
jgi:hypothetical protein